MRTGAIVRLRGAERAADVAPTSNRRMLLLLLLRATQAGPSAAGYDVARERKDSGLQQLYTSARIAGKRLPRAHSKPKRGGIDPAVVRVERADCHASDRALDKLRVEARIANADADPRVCRAPVRPAGGAFAPVRLGSFRDAQTKPGRRRGQESFRQRRDLSREPVKYTHARAGEAGVWWQNEPARGAIIRRRLRFVSADLDGWVVRAREHAAQAADVLLCASDLKIHLHGHVGGL